jgi:hemerythrin
MPGCRISLGGFMAYQWDSSLETGYEKVDKQHRQLVAALNGLIEASAAGKNREEVFRTLDFLTAYTIKHFADEEKLQMEFDYPDYLVHKRYHDEFKLSVEEMAGRIRKEGPTEALIGEVTMAIGGWLLNHIKGDDFRMAAYIKARADD